MTSIVFRLLSRSRYCLVRFRPVDYCSSVVIVLTFLLFCSFLLFSRSGSTITGTSISRASAGSLYPSFGFNLNLLSLFFPSLILLLLTLLVALIRHIGAWWCAITSPESAHRYHRVAQTPNLGKAPLDPSLEPGPSRAVTMSGRVLMAMYIRLPTSSRKGVRAHHSVVSVSTGALLLGHSRRSPVTIGVSTGRASSCPNLSRRRLIDSDCDSDMVRAARSREIAIPSANLTGPSAEMSHLEVSNDWKCLFSSGDEAMEMISSTCNAKMTVSDGVWRR
jgi:hypothetical protein